MLSVCHHTTDEQIQSVICSIPGSLPRTTYTKWQAVALQYESLSTRKQVTTSVQIREAKKTHPKLQLGPALPVTATDSMSNQNFENLSVLRPSYSTWMKFTKLKAVAYKLNFSLIFWYIASSSACLRGDSGSCCEYSEKAVGIGILWCEQATALQTMICFSRAEQLHDATLSFTFLVHSCQLTQQHEVANSVLDPLQLCLLLQWSCYTGLHRHYQREKME